MSVDRPGESEAELVDRRGREADERHRIFWAQVEARRAAGIPDEACALPPAFNHPRDQREGIQGRPRGRGWAS